MSTVLVFDAGKTGCRMGLWVDGDRVGHGEAPGASGIADPGGVDQALSRMAQATDASGSSHPCPGRPVDTVVAGLAGLLSAAEHAPLLRAGLAARYPGAEVIVTSDAITSHAGALSGQAGVVLAAGTGVSVLAVTADGTYSLVDGWGYLLGDAGSGYAIGRAGLDEALRQADGRGGSPVLLDRTVARWGDPRRVPRTVHASENPARVVASFARDVFAAARSGDDASQKICDEAARELALSVAAAVRIAHLDPPVQLATTGGLLNAGPVLTDPLDRHLDQMLPGISRRPADGDALSGGYLIAADPDLPHRRMLSCGHDEGDVR
ncbi:N-acetylglucosamine kinase [Kocuria oceani]|uniref:N-acetylglucosamine kinase n=1 Tax=Kocuria oceani TaxID=988827 RepID=UPI0024055DA8|nr:BadF/BadG/BcrA/BcrD ATPase family protein [Kocuria oceani]